MTLFKNIWFILTLDCNGSAELTSESFDRPLHWAERWAIRLHCLICSKSRQLNRQMTVLDRRLNQVFSQAAEAESLSLSVEARNRIAKRLNADQSK